MSMQSFCLAVRRGVVLSLMAVCLCALSALAANYTLGTGGTTGWENGGWVDMAGKGVRPGDMVYLPAGNRGMLCLKNLQGSAAAPITITNTGGQLVMNSTTDHTLQLWNCKYVIIKGTPVNGDYGIRITGAGPGDFGMLLTQRTTDFEVCDIEICNIPTVGMQAKSSETRPGWAMENVKIHDIYVHDTGCEGLYIGSSFWISQNAHELHNVEIYNNRIENTGWDGIQLGCANIGSSIHDNTIIGFGLAGEGSQDEGIRSNPGTAANIYNNYIADGHGTGIFADPYSDVVYYNNLIIRPGEDGFYIHENGGNLPDTQIYMFNNTIVEPLFYGLAMGAKASQGNAGFFYNNIVAHPGSSGIWRIYGADSVVTDSHSMWVSTVAAAGFVDAANDDYRLASTSAAVNTGINVSSYGVTDDYAGTPRPQMGAYDKGAYEYVDPVQPTILGDFSGDGVVNGADYTTWADNYGKDASAFAAGSRGAGSTGPVNQADYTTWADNYGRSR